MKKSYSDQKGIAHIAVIIIILMAAAVVAVWILTSKQDFAEDNIFSSQPMPFKDVPSDNKNFAAISYLAREGILESDSDGNLNPGQTMTRAEWVIMLVKLAGADPDKSIYKDCYKDIIGKEYESAVCYAKEQGWLDRLGNNAQSMWNLVPPIHAQTDQESFNPDAPLVNSEAAGSLARMMVWEPGKVPTNEEALRFAKDAKIIESQNGGNTIVRENAAGIVYRSLATAPFNQTEYDSEFNNDVSRYSVSDLVNPRPEKASSGSSREARIRHWAENSGIGVEAATAVVDSSSSRDEELRKVRQIRYQRRLEEEKRATGQDLPTYDAFAPLQQVFRNRGGISKDNVVMQRNIPGQDGSVITDNPTINARDSYAIRVMLDENYQVVPRSEWGSGKIKHIMELSHGSFYDIGPVADFYLTRVDPNWAGKANIIMIDVPDGFVTDEASAFDSGGIISSADGSEQWYNFDHPEGVEVMYREALEGIEAQIGQDITADAAPSSKKRECWSEYSQALRECSKTRVDCSSSCLDENFTDPKGYQACSEPCSAAADSCRKAASTAYKGCVDSQRQ